MRIFIKPIPKYILPFSFLFFCILIGLLQIGNYQGRLGDIHADDTPSVYAYFFAFPDRYQNDLLSTYGYAQILATIQNWLPALSFRYLSIPPEIISLIFVFLQFILLGLSVRRFSKIVSGSEIVGWLTTFLIFSGSPWHWNLANYGNMMHSPYAGHLVIPFILFALSAILVEKNKRAMVWLLVGSLIHPTLVLFAIACIALFLIIQLKFKGHWSTWFSLSFVALFTTIPRLLIFTIFGGGDGPLTFSAMENAMLANGHMAPMQMKDRIIAFLMSLPLIFLALRKIKLLHPKYKILWLAGFISCLVLVPLSWIGWRFQVLSLIQLIPQRSSSILIFISLPLIIFYLYHKFITGNIFNKVVSPLLLILIILNNHTFLKSDEYLIFLVLLLVTDLFRNKFSLFDKEDEKEIRSNVDRQDVWTIQPAYALIFLAILAATLYSSWKIGKPASDMESLDGYEIQMWARSHTPEDAMIIDMNRAVSQRASLSTNPYNWFIYNRSKACKDAVDHIRESFKQASILGQSEEDAITIFGREFGADYILRESSDPLDFPVAYQNSSYILYKITPN